MLTRFAIIQFARADVCQCLAVTFEGSERAGLVVLSADLHLVAACPSPTEIQGTAAGVVVYQ